MKKVLILMLAAVLLLCGCGGPEPFDPVVERPAIELPEPQIDPDATVGETQEVEGNEQIHQDNGSAVEVTEAKSAPLAVVVEDQYSEVLTNPNYDSSYCIHIPRFVWNGKSDLMINEQIYADHQRIISENTYDTLPMVSAAYSLGQGAGYASVVTVFAHQDYDYNNLCVFHLNTVTGQEASDDEIIAAFGYTDESFRETVRKVLEDEFLSCGWDSWTDPEDYQEMLAKQTSDETVNDARPYIDEQGRLCIVATTYGFAGPGHWLSRLCLETEDRAPAPEWVRCAVHG